MENIYSHTINMMKQEGSGNELKLINSGAFGCIYRPSLTCSGKVGSAKYITKIQKSERAIANEIRISDRVRKLKGYSRFFAPVLKYCYVRIKKDRVKDLNKCEVFDNVSPAQIESTPYVSMKTRYVGDKDLRAYIFSHTNVSIFLKEMWRTHIHLLKGIQKLFTNNILHYDLKYNNIMYDSDLNSPIIIDFGQSWSLDEIKIEDKISNAFFIFDQYDYWCIDIMICNYIIQKIGYEQSKTKLVTETKINFIYDAFIHGLDNNENKSEKMIINDLFLYNILKNPNKMTNFRKVFDEYINAFINKRTWWELFEDLIKYTNTWDHYSVAVIYLNMLDDTFLSDSSKYNKIVNESPSKMDKYIETLEKVVYCKPNERPAIHSTMKTIEYLLR